ncbi:cell surface protein [Fusobacterium necrophorum]|nr:YadA-like family protein [Fusobacterium necrophorum]AYZ74730.1 cell surface protein [Fusobacterium necrophorum]AZW08987.1 cell surface protein [Fusobacterium necrophorum subsp. necrophorum]
MGNFNLKFFTISLLILLVQNSFAEDPVIKRGNNQDSIVAGLHNKAVNGYSLAYGDANEATGDAASVAFGLKNVASGKSATAFGNANKAGGDTAAAFGNNNTAGGRFSLAFGNKNEVSGTSSAAFGFQNKAKSKESVAVGHENEVEADYGIALGNGNEVKSQKGVAVGYQNEAKGFSNSVFGIESRVSGTSSTVVGNSYEVSGTKSGAFGVGEAGLKSSGISYKYKNEGNESYTIGNRNSIATRTNNNFILGNDVTIGDGINGAVVLGKSSKVTESNTVSVGSENERRRIVFVADGTQDTDAATVGQVKKLISSSTVLGAGMGNVYTKAESDAKFATKDAGNLSASDVDAWRSKLGVIANTAADPKSTSIGNNNKVTGTYSTAVGYKNEVSGNKSGAFGDPNIVTGNRSYAFGNDNTIAGDDNFVLGSNVNIGVGISNSVALGNNSKVKASNEVSVGSVGNERKITNMADGEVSSTSTDAITGRQLYHVMQNSGTTGIENLRNEVNEKFSDVKNEVNHVGSLSAALSALNPMQYDPKAPNQIMAGLGHYRNKQAVAVGLSHHFNNSAMMTAGLALGNESKIKAMANLGFTIRLGRGGETSAEIPQSVIQNEMARLARENQELKKELFIIREQLEELINK